MITEQHLAEWVALVARVDPSGYVATEEDVADMLTAMLALIAEVRRLTASRDDWKARHEQAQGYVDGPGKDIVDGLRSERDAMRDVIASVREDLDKIADGACDPPRNSYGGCTGQCKYVAEPALAKLDAVKNI